MSQFVARTNWLDRKILQVESILLRGLVAVAFCLTLSQVICRYVLDSPLIWTEEFVLYLFVWIVMVGAAAATRTRSHFSLSTLVMYLPPRGAFALAIIVDLAVAVFAAVLLIEGSKMTRGGFSEEASSFPVAMGWFYLSVPLGGALMLWHVFIRFLHAICRSSADPIEELDLTKIEPAK